MLSRVSRLYTTAALALAPAWLPAGQAQAADAPAATHDEAAGIALETPAPPFMLPVVNDFEGGKKWGPGKWAGDGASETKKLVVLSFFATYCGPCKKELPALARLYDAYKDQGLGVMLISIDKGDENRATLVDLAKQSSAHFPVLHDRFQVVARRYGAERLPYMLMLDSAGTVKVVHIGYTEEAEAGLENEVRGLLGLPPLAKVEPIVAKGKKSGKNPTRDAVQKKPAAGKEP